MGVPPDDVDDVCQEVFVQVYRYLATFESRADIRTWLYRICLSQAGRLRRRVRVTRLVAGLFLRPGAASPEPSADPGFSDEEAQRRVRVALDQLGDKHRAVLLLFEVEGLTGDEIARVMECPVATVWSRLHYARQSFTRAIEDGDLAALRKDRLRDPVDVLEPVTGERRYHAT
jgi:RNA polymerase sigma-70 factor (ECF subfamily)